MKSFSFNEQKDRLRWHDIHQGACPLVYLHGLGCASSSDYPQVVASSGYCRRRTWLVDLPGAGFSDKPEGAIYDSWSQADTLCNWLTSTCTHRFSLFGHSAGAFIAMNLVTAMPGRVANLILCQPGLSDYGVGLLKTITAMSEGEFIQTGFQQLLTQLREAGDNDDWLGPFQVCSAQAIYQWASSALVDNDHGNWVHSLKKLPLQKKSVILSDRSPSEEIRQFRLAGCRVELVSHSGHRMAYDNPEGLAKAIARLIN